MNEIPSLIRVEINGVEHELAPTMGDLVRYERKWGSFDADGAMTPEQLLYLTWLMAVRMKAVDGDFEAFLDAVGPLEPVVSPKVLPKPQSRKSSQRPGLTGVA